jgi:hypothetical protein
MWLNGEKGQKEIDVKCPEKPSTRAPHNVAPEVKEEKQDVTQHAWKKREENKDCV